MLRNKKKLFAGIFILVFIATSVPLFGDFKTSLSLKTNSTYAETFTYNDSINYEVINGEITITGCAKDSITLDIPNEIDGIPVTKLSSNAFWRALDLEVINIPDSVVLIEEYTFSSNLNLTEMNVDENNQNYTSVDGVLFNKDVSELIQFPIKKSSIIYEVPATVTTLKTRAFSQAEIRGVKLPTGLKTIEASTFLGCFQLLNITIPSTVSNIGVYSFISCPLLTDIKVSRANEYYASLDGVLYTYDGTTLVQYPVGRTETEYIIKDGTEIINDGAFMNCTALTSVTIPEGVISIKQSAFDNTGLKSVTIPSTVEVLGNCAFWQCSDLAEVNFNGNSNLNEMGEAVFGMCESLKKIEIPNGVSYLELGAFLSCTNLEEVILPNSLSNIGMAAFDSCTSLKSITIPDSTNRIFTLAFNNCTSLTDVYIPHHIISIADGALGYKYSSSGGLEHNPILTIHSYDGTVAEQYAIENALDFASLGEIPLPTGDLNRDGVISSDELKQLMVTIFGEKKINGVTSITPKQAQYADTNNDGVLNVFDKVNMKRNILYQNNN